MIFILGCCLDYLSFIFFFYLTQISPLLKDYSELTILLFNYPSQLLGTFPVSDYQVSLCKTEPIYLSSLSILHSNISSFPRNHLTFSLHDSSPSVLLRGGGNGSSPAPWGRGKSSLRSVNGGDFR